MVSVLVRELLYSRVDIDDGYAKNYGLDPLLAELVSEVVRAGDARAFKIRPESVMVHQVSRDGTRMVTRYEGVWSPASARFVGGEYDGDEVEVSRDAATGLPLHTLTLPYRMNPSWSDAEYPTAVTSNPSYQRSGIDPIDDVWVYDTIR